MFSILLFWIAFSAFTGRPLPFAYLLLPPTQNISACGASTVLSAYPVAGYTSTPTWNDGSVGNNMTVTASGDYWWQVTGPNVVINGDFTSGTTGFTSNYVYKNPLIPCGGGCNILGAEATYSVYTNPHTLHSGFDAMVDHTNNSVGPRNMLIVNGAPTANETVWSENITILPNTDYVFSVWVTSVNPVAPAVLQFSVNGSPLTANPINLSATLPDGTWQYFTAIWNSGSASGTVPIALVNQNTIANGNDFAVDDIVFAPVYRQNLHVVFNPKPVLALNGPHSSCGVYDLTQTIVGYDPATYTYVFKDSLGNVVTNPSAITQSGVYTITEQNIITGCTSLPQTTTITIQPAPQKPGITSL